MINANTLYSALAPYGFETTANVCYGSWRNYAVSILSAQYSVFQLSFAVRADKKDKNLAKSLRAELRQQLGKGLSTVLNLGNTLQFAYRFDGKTPLADQFVRTADAIAAALSAHGLSPAVTCAVCGGGTPDSLCVVNTYQPVHAACMHQKLETAKEQAMENKENGSYLTGTLGAILGALVGTILPLVMLIATDTLYALLFALVPLAAMFGYRKFKGKSDKISIVIVIVVSILAVVLMAYAVIVYYIMQQMGVGLGTAMSFVSRFMSGSDFAELLGQFWKGFLFMGLGIVISWGYLTKTSSAEVKNTATLLETMRPNPMFSQDYAQSENPAPQQSQQFFWNGQG